MPARRFAPTLLVLAVALALAGCGKKDGKEAATQVAARVGSEEISVHQINQVLARANTGAATPEAAQSRSREVLERLIDQQVAVDAATANKLHRTPETVAALEAARREILARAYLQSIAAGVTKPSAEEIRKFNAENPALFSQRRVFNVQEVVVQGADSTTVAQLRIFANGDKSLEAAAAWLKEKNIKFAGGVATRAAEQIPLELLARVHALKDGQSMLVEVPQGATLLRVASSQSAPVAEATALPFIEQFLTNQRATKAVAENIKQLRADVKITYMGEFAKDAAADKTTLEKGVKGLQ